MKENTKNKIIAFGFFIILIFIFCMNIFIKDKDISITERRKLAQFPNITISKVLNGEVTKNWEKYATDQFVARDLFRNIKAFYSINIAKQKDNNKLFEKDNAIYKMDYPLNEKNVEKTADKINYVYNKYLQNMNVYYAIIPDKNYYLKQDDHLKMDYDKLKHIMNKNLYNLKYIDIWDTLQLEDYYRTDIHWKQENLQKTADKIKKAMSVETNNQYYIKVDIGDFYGTYFGQIPVNIPPDKMYILINDTIKNAITYNYEKNKEEKIYVTPNTKDKYDVYLSGATPLISIENKNINTKKELLLFRDSFGSSIAPLLLENYSKITLIDLRYISSELLDKYIDFNKQDVLFLYSTLILNQNILK